jgi:transcriptional regulator with XRE-family HTH domain
MGERSAAEIASYIRDARKRAGVTQADVADALGVDKSAVSRLERGERGIAVGELARVARLIGVSVDELLFEELPEEVLLRAEDDQHATEATALTDELIEDFLYVDALVGD